MGIATSSGGTPKPQDPRETFLRKIFTTKVAVYAKKMKAGVGLQSLSPKVLKKMLHAKGGEEVLRKLCTERIYGKLAEMGVGYGVDDAAISEAVDVFLEGVKKGSDAVVARPIAQGDEVKPAQDGRLDYLLNPDNLPMHKVKGVPPTSDHRWLRVVQKGEKLIALTAPKAGKAGRNVLGEDVPPASPQTPSLSSVLGQNTTVAGDFLIALCDGACEENATGRVRIVPEISVRAVDATTGSLPESGVSKANILVRGDIKAPYGVASSETVFVGLDRDGGVVEPSAYVSAQNLVVRGTILGDPAAKNNSKEKGLVLEAQDVCVAREIDGRQVRAEHILVAGTCRFAQIDADAAVRVDGDLVGGVVTCHRGLTVAGDLGSDEGGSHTQIIVPSQGAETRKTQRLTQAVQKHKRDVADLQGQMEQMDADNAKRAKTDAYWSALISEDLRPPRTSFEANTLRQFKDMLNQKKARMREQAALRQEIQRIQNQLEEAETDGGNTEFSLRVGGQLNLDVRLMVLRELTDEELEARIDYKFESTQFSNVTLRDIQSRLGNLANEYLQTQTAHNDARKQAIDKMFEGREKRPTGPQIEHKQFEMPFVWHGDENEKGDGQGPLQIATTAFVDTKEPRKLFIRTEAKAREALRHVEVGVSQNGARVDFAVRAGGGKGLRWQEDSNMRQLVDNLRVKGLPGMAFLAGEALNEQDVPESRGVGEVDVEEEGVEEDNAAEDAGETEEL